MTEPVFEGFIEIPEHTETPEHIGNYRNTLYFFFHFILLKIVFNCCLFLCFLDKFDLSIQ